MIPINLTSGRFPDGVYLLYASSPPGQHEQLPPSPTNNDRYAWEQAMVRNLQTLYRRLDRETIPAPAAERLHFEHHLDICVYPSSETIVSTNNNQLLRLWWLGHACGNAKFSLQQQTAHSSQSSHLTWAA